MRHALVIARRELRERNFVLIASAVLAIVPFLFAMLPVGRRLGRTTMVAGVASVVGPVLTIGLALILGASIVGRELSERRMSFYFARPISAASLWAGKVIAAMMLILGTFAISLLPAIAFAHRDWSRVVFAGLPEIAAATLGGAFILFLLAHFVSVIARSRSLLAIVDLVLAVAAVLLGTMIVRPLFNNLSVENGRWTLGYLLVAWCVSVLLAGAWQLSRGRTDTRANHRELSRATWVLLGAFMIAGAGWSAWVLLARPSDLAKAYAFPVSGDEWMIAGGEARLRGDFQPHFLMNRKTGEWFRLLNARWHVAAFSRTGSAVLLIEQVRTAKSVRGELFIRKLSGDRELITTGIVVSPSSNVMPSDDLERVAVRSGETLSVHDLKSHALLASVRLPVTNHVGRMFFVNRDTLRLYLQQTADGVHTIQVYELDIPARRLTRTGQMSASARWLYIAANADGSALLVSIDPKSANQVSLVDGRTLQIRRTLDGTDHDSSNAFLSDGSIAAIASKGVLRFYEADGTPRRDVPIPVLRGQIIDIGRPDKLVLSVWDGEMPGYSTYTLTVLDSKRGVVEREVRRVRYVGDWSWLDPRKTVANRTGELIITDKDGRVWQWNALTGAKKKLLGS